MTGRALQLPGINGYRVTIIPTPQKKNSEKVKSNRGGLLYVPVKLPRLNCENKQSIFFSCCLFCNSGGRGSSSGCRIAKLAFDSATVCLTIQKSQ